MNATWAVSSKKPGRVQGYECDHAQQDVGVARHLIGLGERMGTAEEPRTGQPDELPWLGFAGSGEQPVAAVVSQEWSAERDGTGQPIVPTRAVWLPWATVSAQQMNCLSLWKATRALRWPTVDGGPEGASGYHVDLGAIDVPDWDRVVGDVDRFGFPVVSALAATIVSGRHVVIVLEAGDFVPLEERVRFLDAVLALLPYGARYCAPVLTWANSTSNDAAVLAFSNRARPGQVGVRWTELDRLPQPTGKGRQYLDELDQIRAVEHDVRDIVDHLRTDTDRLRELKDISVERLRGVRLASLAHEEIRQGTARVARVCEVLDRKAYPRTYLPAYVEFLAANAAERSEKKAEQAIVEHWVPEFGTILGDLTRRAAEKPVEWGVKWLQLSMKAGERNEKAVTSYLVSALRQPAVLPDEPAFSAVANVILHYLTATTTIDRETYECLVGQPQALVDAVGAVVRPESSRKGPVRSKLKNLKDQYRKNINRALSSLNVLSSSDGAQWLRPILLTVSGGQELIDERDIAALAALGVEAFSCFVDVFVPRVSPNTTVGIVWPVVTEFLARQGAENGDKPRDLLDGIVAEVEHNGPDLSPANRARVDVWRLLAERDPLGPDLRDKPSDEYLQEFREALLQPGWQPHVLSLITRQLMAYLKGNVEVIPVDTVVRLDKGLADLGISLKSDYLTHLAELLKNGQHRRAPVRHLPEDWWRDLLDRPDLAAYRAWIELHDLVAEQATVQAVFDKVVLTLGQQFVRHDVLTSLISYAGTCDPPVAAELLCRLCDHDAAGMTLAAEVRDALLDDRSGTSERFGRYISERAVKAHQELARCDWLGRTLSARLEAGGSR